MTAARPELVAGAGTQQNGKNIVRLALVYLWRRDDAREVLAPAPGSAWFAIGQFGVTTLEGLVRDAVEQRLTEFLRSTRLFTR